MTMFDPALRICDSMDVRAPLPIATMTITAATPMIMPSAVSAVRMALRRSALMAMRKVIAMDMAASRGHQRVGLGQRVDLIKLTDRVPAVCHLLVGANAAIAKRDDSRGVLGDLLLVRNQHDRETPLAIEALKDFHHFHARPRIEVPR